MRYFTQAWQTGSLTDEQHDASLAANGARIEEIKPQLPPDLKKLATYEINLHDGLMRRITLDRPAGTLTIGLRCGDLQVGYFDVDLAYADVDLKMLDPDVLKAIATDPETELLSSEIDLAQRGRFVHRMIFWSRPTREIEVEFRGLRLLTKLRPSREFVKAKQKYRELGKAKRK